MYLPSPGVSNYLSILQVKYAAPILFVDRKCLVPEWPLGLNIWETVLTTPGFRQNLKIRNFSALHGSVDSNPSSHVYLLAPKINSTIFLVLPLKPFEPIPLAPGSAPQING
jgi:hypothetical protein